MPKKISQKSKERVMELLIDGLSIREVSNITDISKSTVGRIRLSIENNITKHTKIGRPKKISPRYERNIVRKILSGKFSNATQISNDFARNDQLIISPQTIRRVLKGQGLKAKTKKKKPFLKKIYKRKRLAFAKKYKNWKSEDWEKVIWSDESKFNLFSSDGREYCWMKVGEPISERVIKPTMKYGGGSVTIWGCLTKDGPGYMCKIDGRLDADLYVKILGDELLKTYEYYGFEKNEMTFQQDNDPKHTSKKAVEWLEENKIEVMQWPPQSPDMNPIEHMWNELDKRIRRRGEITSVEQLWEVMQDEWEKFDVNYCLKLIHSMPQRINDLLKSKGGYTRW